MPETHLQQQITPKELAGCRRVAAYLRRTAKPYLSDIFDNSPEITAKRNSKDKPFVEFWIIFFPILIEKYDNQMRWAIRAFAEEQISAEQLKNITDKYIKAHTVVWFNGVQYRLIDNLD